MSRGGQITRVIVFRWIDVQPAVLENRRSLGSVSRDSPI